MINIRSFNHLVIDQKWQQRWERDRVFEVEDFPKRPYYCLVEFPYPSGEGLHVGHPRSYTALDIIARKRRMEGNDVLYPIGYDAFGLPAENFAIKKGIHPSITTKKNIERFRRQLKSMGFSFAWSREVDTTDPKYYKWTQWIFLQFVKAGLAYKAKVSINWCPSCKIGLANEEVVGGRCERCGSPVEMREKEQWMLKITAYADRLLEDLKTVDYLPQIKAQQENWIGKSMGARLRFEVEGSQDVVAVFTTRPDTIFGATYLVLAPEHPLVDRITTLEQKRVVQNYRKATQRKSLFERTENAKEKTGVWSGAFALHPLTQQRLPVWVADYIVMHYGTGAVMAVPAHDQRDAEFARVYQLPSVVVIEPITGTPKPDEEFRRSVGVLVQDPGTGKLLTIDWGMDHGGIIFIGGGQEEGEALEKTAAREVREETGYTDLEFVARSETIHHHYYAHSKGKQRGIEAIGFYFKLKSSAQTSPKLEKDEQGKFKVAWITVEEAKAKIQDPLHRYLLEKFILGQVYAGEGPLVASGTFNGLVGQAAQQAVVKALRAEGNAEMATVYKLRDWVFSRQHYWGEPIPMIQCTDCGWVPVPERQLPVELPYVEKYQPTDTGESPLATMTDWLNVPCPSCGKPGRRETDTMPNWAGSSWYFLRYLDPRNDKQFADLKKLTHWMPVDLYNGGMEHTTLHLLYARFWNKFLFDLGLVPTSEPFHHRHSHGLILGEGGAKMSKSKGNVVNPDELVEEYGADTLRMYLMFIGPFEEPAGWNAAGVMGIRRFLDKAYSFSQRAWSAPIGEIAVDLERLVQQTIKKVSDDIEHFRFNTAVSQLMILMNAFAKFGSSQTQFETFVILLSPFAPHLCEELWQQLGHPELVCRQAWPKVDVAALAPTRATIIIQINGKLRDRIEVEAGLPQEKIEALVLALPKVLNYIPNGRPQVRKIIFVQDKIVNLVI